MKILNKKIILYFIFFYVIYLISLITEFRIKIMLGFDATSNYLSINSFRGVFQIGFNWPIAPTQNGYYYIGLDENWRLSYITQFLDNVWMFSVDHDNGANVVSCSYIVLLPIFFLVYFVSLWINRDMGVNSPKHELGTNE